MDSVEGDGQDNFISYIENEQEPRKNAQIKLIDLSKQPNLSDRVAPHHSANVSIDEPIHNFPLAQTLERPIS